MKKCLALLLLAALATTARADVLAVWNSVGADASGSYAAAATNSGVIASHLAVGSGLSPYTNLKDAFCANGYESTTKAAAFSAGDYWTVSLTPKENWQLNLSSLVYTFRRASKGPTWWAWYYSTNASAATADWTMIGSLVNDTTTDYTERVIDVSGVAALQNLSGTMHFRFVAWGGDSTKLATGSFAKAKDVLVFNGTAVNLATPPTITFAGDRTVGLSNTLSVTVSAAPEGSTVTSCTVSSGFPGTCSFANGTATITPTGAEAVGNTYTLTAVAANGYGTSTNTFDFAVTRYIPEGAIFIDFEDLPTTSTSYLSNSVVTLAGTQWVLHNAITKMDANDRFNGANALRMNHNWNEGFISTSTNAVASNGLSYVSFVYATRGNYTNGATVTVEISLKGKDWIAAGSVETADVHVPTTYQTPYIGIAEPLCVRIRASGQDSCNIDDILLAKYAENPDSGEYEKYLLRYNVTPGDQLTGEDDDYDGDGATNAEEFAAGTNPYDKTSKP